MAFFVCELSWARGKVPYRDCSEAEISDAGSPGFRVNVNLYSKISPQKKVALTSATFKISE
jgi:hypothetical protein